MTEIEIEDDVPLPDPATTRRYPFNKMKVGQSFYGGQEKLFRPLPPITRCAPQDVRFTARREGDHYRVWRIK